MIARFLGLLLVSFSVTMLPPVAVSLYYDDGEANHFIYATLLQAAAGVVLWYPARGAQAQLTHRDGFVIVGLFWVVLSLASSIPFIFSSHLQFVDALFESVSGFTTTGATVIVGLEALPRSILYYRQQIQWLGGMGIIVLAVAVLPMLGIGGMQLVRAETPGPMKDDKLTPRIKETATRLWIIYVTFTVACAVAFRLAGMSWFDATGHAMSTLSTGGFSTHDASLGYFNSAAIEIIAVVFMLIGAINFTLHFRALTGRRAAPYLRDEECQVFAGVIFVSVVVITVVLVAAPEHRSTVDDLRAAVVQVVSIITTTGFTTANFAAWPLLTPVLLLFISFVGGCSGSTAGGMKAVRWLLMWRQGMREVALLVHPKGEFPIKLNGRAIPERVIASVWGFFAVYALTFGILMLLMMSTGVDQITAFSAIATCLNNLGPGLGAVASNFVEISNAGVAIAIVAMLLGRLEIFALLVLVSPIYWRR